MLLNVLFQSHEYFHSGSLNFVAETFGCQMIMKPTWHKYMEMIGDKSQRLSKDRSMVTKRNRVREDSVNM